MMMPIDTVQKIVPKIRLYHTSDTLCGVLEVGTPSSNL